MPIGPDTTPAPLRVPHPVAYTVLYIPFGALAGWVSVALTFMASAAGIPVAETALLTGANMLTTWLKWLWAPLVDVTLSPKKWYAIATTCTAAGVIAMSALPLTPESLPLLLVVIAVTSLINSIVGMSIEAIMAVTTSEAEQGRVSAWFQAGNLGGSAFGGALGLLLLKTLPAPWMAGTVIGVAFLACILALGWVPTLPPHRAVGGALGATRQVASDLWATLRTRSGFLAGLLCVLPIGTGAAASVLAQAEVAGYWGAGARAVGLVQGLLAGAVMTLGCFAGGWLCDRFHPRTVYAGIGLGLALVAIGMGIAPATVTMYVVWNMAYSLGVGLAFAGFTAVVLNTIGKTSAATKYNFFASLSNFPIWWLGLLLGHVADTALGKTITPASGGAPIPANRVDLWLTTVLEFFHRSPGAVSMLYCEALLGVVAVALFALVVQALPARPRKDGPLSTAR